MKSRGLSLLAWIMALAALFVVSLSGPAKQATAEGTFSYDFETSLSPWIPAAYCADVQAFHLVRETNDNSCPTNGTRYAALGIDTATTSSAPIWMTTSFEGYGLDYVNLDWKAKDKGGCTGCTPLVYVGLDAPTQNSDFVQLAPTIDNTWRFYSYSTSVIASGTVYVAFGWQKTSGSLIAGTQVGFDCINIDISTGDIPPPSP